MINILVFVLAFFLLFNSATTYAHAIIAIVPSFLIPIVTILAWIIGIISAPILGLSALYYKLKNKSIFFGLMMGLIIIILFVIIIGILLKVVNWERPIY